MSKNVFSLNRSVAYLRRRASENRRQGRIGEAATLLRLAIESEFPPAPELLSDYSELLSSVGQYEASDELLYEMLQTADEEEQGACFYALGENAYARGEMRRAIDYLSLFLDGTCADEAYNHALDLLEDAQAAVCDPPIERGRGDTYAQRLVNHALDQLRDGYDVNAMRILRRANRVHPGPDVDSLMAICAMTREEWSTAVDYCRRALRRRPEDVRMLCTLTSAYAALGETKKVQWTLVRALRSVKSEQDDITVGQCAADLGLHGVVQLCCGRVLKKNPYHPIAAQLYAIACVNTGRLRRASRVWGALARIRGEDTVVGFYHHLVSKWIEKNQAGRHLDYSFQVPPKEMRRRLTEIAQYFADVGEEDLSAQFDADASLCAQVRWLLYTTSEQDTIMRAALTILARVGGERAKRMLLCMLLSDMHTDEQKREALAILAEMRYDRPCFVFLHDTLARAIPQDAETQLLPQDDEDIVQEAAKSMGVEDGKQVEEIRRIWARFVAVAGDELMIFTHAALWPLALEWAYGKIEDKNIGTREIARREGVPSRLIRRLGRKILSAQKERE